MSELKMLDHQKIILDNISENYQLFRKELEKSLKWLNDGDKQKLYIWVKSRFWNSHEDIIREVFGKVAA